MPTDSSVPPPLLSTDSVMSEVRAQVREQFRARATDPELVDELARLYLEDFTVDDPQRLMLPTLLLTDRWRPELAVKLKSHRAGLIGRTVESVKRLVLLPLNRWLFEYARDNFRRQDRLNIVMLACLERMALENLRLRREIDAVRAAAGAPESPKTPPSA